MNTDDIPAPLALHEETVRPEWIDYNGHMNVAFYVLAFDHATDAMLEFLELTHDYKIKANTTTFVADMNVTYVQEVHEGDPLRFTTRILNCDEKRIHFWHEMYHATEGYLAATNELLSLHIDLTNRRVGLMANASTRQRSESGDSNDEVAAESGAKARSKTSAACFGTSTMMVQPETAFIAGPCAWSRFGDELRHDALRACVVEGNC